MERTFEPLTDSEQEWLKAQMDNAAEIVSRYAPEHAGEPRSLKALDRAFASFLAGEPDAGPEANDVVTAVGVAFGSQLVEQLGFQWVIATDHWGTDIAVLARPGRGDVAVFPTDFVAKRYEGKVADFLEDSLAMIRQSLQEVDADWGA